jgi:hypothetical protein
MGVTSSPKKWDEKWAEQAASQHLQIRVSKIIFIPLSCGWLECKPEKIVFLIYNNLGWKGRDK